VKKTQKCFVVLLLGGITGFVVPASGRADFSFDPDGPGPLAPVTAHTFAYLPDNAIAVGGMDAIRTFLATGTRVPITALYQARLTAVTDTNGVSQPLGNINNHLHTGVGVYQITVVAKVTEEIVTVVPLGGTLGVALFKVTPAAGDFEKIFYKATTPAGLANPLTGANYGTGTLIYQGHPRVTPNMSDSNFTTSLDSAPPGHPGTHVALDQNGANNYPGINSVSGNGGSTIELKTDSVNTAWFLDGLKSVALSEFTGQQKLPFNQVDPTAMFFNGQAGATVASLGNVNGHLTPGTGYVLGPNILFQLDASQSFAAIPEPATVVLFAAGLGGLGLIRVVRRRFKA
jgi:hypothetical protein